MLWRFLERQCYNEARDNEQLLACGEIYQINSIGQKR